MLRIFGMASCGETYPGCDITDAEWEFIQAIERYQRKFHRRYPAWREVLHVLRCLGYRKIAKSVEVGQFQVEDDQPPTETDLQLMRTTDVNDSPTSDRG